MSQPIVQLKTITPTTSPTIQPGMTPTSHVSIANMQPPKPVDTAAANAIHTENVFSIDPVARGDDGARPFYGWNTNLDGFADAYLAVDRDNMKLDQTYDVLIVVLVSYPGGTTPQHDPHQGGNRVAVQIGHRSYRKTSLSCDVPLYPGWNLISLPLIPEDTGIERVLADTADNVAILWQYDGGTGRWLWYVPGHVQSTLTTLQDGVGYWVRMIASDTLRFVGREVPMPRQYDLVEGWNLVGFTSMNALHHSAYLRDLYTEEVPGYRIIWGRDAAEAKYFQSALYHPSFGWFDEARGGKLEPGHGYWLWAAEGGTVVIP